MSPVLSLRHLSFAYSSAAPLFDDVDFELGPGWAGLVGPNGSGKTTLLRLVAGELPPDAGRVHVHPGGARLRLCPQRVEALDGDVRAFADSLDGLAHRVRGALELDPSTLSRWDTLSPGERKRWQVGAALAGEPAVLLLDEPTNHLDGEARRLLERALRAFTGVGVLVSHDRGFLNALCDRTVRCTPGAARLYRGPYDRARETWQAEEKARDAAWSRLRQEEDRLRRHLQATREQRGKVQKKRRSASAGAGGEHAASSSFRSARRRSPAISIARDMRVTGGALDRVGRELAGFRFEREHGRSLFVDWAPVPAPVLMELRTEALRAGERVLVRDVDVQLRRESRIHLRGRNGSGKTTLLEALLRGRRVPEDRLLYLPQELDARAEAALLADVHALGTDVRGRALTLLAALGVDPDRLLASGRPSPGEARKLWLALGLGRRVWGLVLDEPTNHLDLPSIERLEVALADYPGALLLVSHDDRLGAAITDTCWELADADLVVRATDTGSG